MCAPETIRVFGSFNPWYVGGGVKSANSSFAAKSTIAVSILGMLEGVLKASALRTVHLSLLPGFNPWYVGGGVKRSPSASETGTSVGFNPWYVGGGVKSLP